MVTYYNKKDLINFGKYLLSEKRTKKITDNYDENDNISLEVRLQEVYHSDIENFITSIDKAPYKLRKETVLERLKKGEIQFLNDNHDVELFGYLTHENLNYNGFNYYYGYNDYCATPFKDVPMIRLSDVIV